MQSEYYLPSKIGSYLRRLELDYELAGEHKRLEIVRAARVLVIEAVVRDNWNGGTFEHDLRMFLPEDVLRQIRITEQKTIAAAICSDLNNCAYEVDNESFRAVYLTLNDEADADYQRSTPASQRTPIPPQSLSIWKPGLLRLFISHRDDYKSQATSLAKALETYGVSCFVAHDQIAATKEWRREIINGLETMEIMLVFLTDDFERSTWTNQEIGFALGKGIPIISLKLQGKDPPGFISHEQALRGSLNDAASSAKKTLQNPSRETWTQRTSSRLPHHCIL